MRNNVNSFYEILTRAKKDNASLIYASSAAVYGSLSSPQYVGNENPENPYAYSKFMMDQIAMRFSSENPDLRIIGLRFFNVYGPREFYKSSTSSMVIQLGHQILDGSPPRLFEKSNQIYRDFIYIDDVIQANIKACDSSINGTYNVGTGIARNFQEIADILQKELLTDYGTDYFQNPYDGYQMHTKADIFDTSKNIGFQPQFSLEQGIKEYIPDIKLTHG
jgi:ADP-L-glycero-D-manno-heptose 6-epimerase